MPLDSVCEPVAAFPKELTGDLAVGWPSAGKPAGNIARGVRCFPAGKYLIYYRNTRGVLVGLGGLEPPTSPLSVMVGTKWGTLCVKEGGMNLRRS